MAAAAKASKNGSQSNLRAYWSQEIERGKKRYRTFWSDGDDIVDAYRLQKSDGNNLTNKDKYNILYSSTETIRPNLYAQRPNVRVKKRNKDTNNPVVLLATELLEGSCAYVIEEEDFDHTMENCVEDLLLPGLGTGWVRYEPKFGTADNDNDPESAPPLLDEMVKIDYVYWQDWMCGVSRGWGTVPWIARRVWMTKEEATKRFGAEKANKLSYVARTGENRREQDETSETTEIWEIWDKRNRTVYWYSDSYGEDVLDTKVDPLKLKNFFPCPRPMRAISNTRTFVPRGLYSQYKSQAETLNTLTRRIRLLGEALRVVGVYDGSNPKLADILAPNAGNRMIAVDSWAMFAQTGGIKGNVEWLPLDQIVTTLVQLQQARETCKIEIYEITGFSDIVRGVSKASETLGAQNLKANWAGARVRKMQKEVQRFARDLIALAGEIIAEHCSPATIALFSGVDVPTAEQVQADPNVQAQVQAFVQACALLKNEARRLATVDIETDSTIMADEEAERADRMAFLAAAGAFLQQAVPAMETTPELGPLLGAMLMFTVRTFPSSRPIEEEFEKVQKALANKPPKPPEDNGNAAKAQTAQAVAGMKAQTDGARIQAEAQTSQQEIAAKSQYEMGKLAHESQAELNRHNEAMAGLSLKERELALREREVAVKEAELGIKQQVADTGEFKAEHDAQVDEAAVQQQDEQNEHARTMDHANVEQQYDKMDRDDANADKALTKKKE